MIDEALAKGPSPEATTILTERKATAQAQIDKIENPPATEEIVTTKEIALEVVDKLEEAMAREESVLDMLNTHFKNRDFGTASKKDVVKAKQKIHSAVQYEGQAGDDIQKSLEKIDDAYDVLGIE